MLERLRVVPKHKGTDHLQGDIKRRIKEQLSMIGPPNAGKSSLHARLNSRTSAALRVVQ